MVTVPTDTRVESVLDAPILDVELEPGQVSGLSLPELIALLLTADDPIRSFIGLAAEQRSHWYRFLVRCATRALRDRGATHREWGGSDELVERIRSGLLEAGGSPEAWQLHVPDIAHPAFLQPPVQSGHGFATLAEAGYTEKPISMLTALLGSKNFERKSEAVRSLSGAELVYALVEFQGGVIFGGRGNYETQLTPSRSGKGSGVPFMGLRLPEGLGATFQRDVALFLRAQSHIRSQLGLDGTVWALWCEPWDGERSLLSTSLDPAFIPMARMIRVGPKGDDGRYRDLWFRTSGGSRVNDVSDGALYGDPFTPTIPNPRAAGGRKVRGVMEGGFPYPEAAELMGLSERDVAPSDTVRAFLEEPGSDQRPDVQVEFEGVAFEQGKTLGFYRRMLPLRDTGGVAGVFMPDPEPYRAAHGRMLGMVKEAKSILRGAARIMVGGEPRPRSGDEAVAGIPTLELDAFADEGDAYLQHLIEYGRREEAEDRGWDREWAIQVSEWARQAFHRALPLLVAPSGQRIRREADAMNYLEGRLWKLRGGDEAGEVYLENEEVTT